MKLAADRIKDEKDTLVKELAAATKRCGGFDSNLGQCCVPLLSSLLLFCLPLHSISLLSSPHRCGAFGSSSTRQRLLAPANCCPVFADRTIHRGEQTLLVHLGKCKELKNKENFGNMDPYAVLILGSEEVKAPTKDPYPYMLDGARQACRSVEKTGGGTDIDFTNDAPIRMMYDPSLTHLVTETPDAPMKVRQFYCVRPISCGTRSIVAGCLCWQVVQLWDREDAGAMAAAAENRQENQQNPAGYKFQYPSRKDDFIGQLFIKLDEIPATMMTTPGTTNTNLVGKNRASGEPVEVKVDLWGVKSKSSSKRHGTVELKLFYFDGNAEARKEADAIETQLVSRTQRHAQSTLSFNTLCIHLVYPPCVSNTLCIQHLVYPPCVSNHLRAEAFLGLGIELWGRQCRIGKAMIAHSGAPGRL